MVEIVGRVVGHAELFHDMTRALVADGGHGDDLGEFQRLEAIGERGLCALGGIAVAPVLIREPPADFDTGGKVGREPWGGEADEADKLSKTRHLDRPEAEAFLGEVRLDSVYHRVAFGGREGAGEALHHARVGVEGSKRRTVAGTPAAQEQAVGVKHGTCVMIRPFSRGVNNPGLKPVALDKEKEACQG